MLSRIPGSDMARLATAALLQGVFSAAVFAPFSFTYRLHSFLDIASATYPIVPWSSVLIATCYLLFLVQAMLVSVAALVSASESKASGSSDSNNSFDPMEDIVSEDGASRARAIWTEPVGSGALCQLRRLCALNAIAFVTSVGLAFVLVSPR